MSLYSVSHHKADCKVSYYAENFACTAFSTFPSAMFIWEKLGYNKRYFGIKVCFIRDHTQIIQNNC